MQTSPPVARFSTNPKIIKLYSFNEQAVTSSCSTTLVFHCKLIFPLIIGVNVNERLICSGKNGPKLSPDYHWTILHLHASCRTKEESIQSTFLLGTCSTLTKSFMCLVKNEICSCCSSSMKWKKLSDIITWDDV